MRKINKGYSVLTVVFILAFATLSLSLTLVWVSIFLKKATKNVNHYTKWEPFFQILNDDVLPNIGLGIGDEYTSPHSGWFSELPDEVDGYEITVTPEDSLLDINHLNLKSFFTITSDQSEDANGNLFNKTGITVTFDPKVGFITPTPSPEPSAEDHSNDLVFKEKEFEDYLYYPEDIKDNLEYRNFEYIKDYFSIYTVPNLNTVDEDRLELYLLSKNFEEDFINAFKQKVAGYRKKQQYIKYKKQKHNNLMIGETAFESFKSLKWDDADELYILFDYTGRVNLNFVSENVFKTIVTACGPKNVDYKKYWKTIKKMQEDEQDIKEMDVDNIFGNDFLYYEKMISRTGFSKFFRVTITKDTKTLTTLVRRYKIREIEYKVPAVWAIDTSIKRRRNVAKDASDDEIDEEGDVTSDVPDENDDGFNIFGL